MGNKKPTHWSASARHSSHYGGAGTQLFDVVDLMLVFACFAIVMAVLMVCCDRQMVINQNSGVKKPPVVSCIFSTGHVEVSRRSVLPTEAGVEFYTIPLKKQPPRIDISDFQVLKTIFQRERKAFAWSDSHVSP